MRILFDHGTPSGIIRALAVHEVTEAIDRGWDRISNGELLTKAEAAGYELLLTTDKRIRYQQNVNAVDAATPGSYVEVEIPFE